MGANVYKLEQRNKSFIIKLKENENKNEAESESYKVQINSDSERRNEVLTGQNNLTQIDINVYS